MLVVLCVLPLGSVVPFQKLVHFTISCVRMVAIFLLLSLDLLLRCLFLNSSSHDVLDNYSGIFTVAQDSVIGNPHPDCVRLLLLDHIGLVF